MSKFSHGGHEPYGARKVSQWIEATYRPVRLPQSDHVWIAYELPSGRTVIVPGPSTGSRPVATGTAKKIATDIGMTFEEFREAIGHPIIKRGKPSRQVIRNVRTGCTKGEVVAQAKAVHRALNDLESAIRSGDRDPAFYLRLHQRLTAAMGEVQSAITQTNQRGAA